MRTHRSMLVAASLGFAVLGTGCASIIKGGGPQSVSIRSTPSDADVKVYEVKTGNSIAAGKTPMLVPLNKSTGFFAGAQYRVVVEKQGFANREVLIEANANGWYIAGNLAFGGLIGWLIVDPATGAMWTLSPEELSLELQPAPGAAVASKPIAFIELDALAADHPELLGKMKRLPVAAD